VKTPSTFLWVAAFLFPAAPLPGDIIVSWSDSGWYDSTGFHARSNNNYIVGFQGTYLVIGTEPPFTYMPITYHDFFVFDLSTVTGPINSGILSIFNPAPSTCGFPCGYQSLSPTETYTVFDVSTPLNELDANHTGVGSLLSPAIFNDLGSGPVFGSTTVSASDNGSMVNIVLNREAIDAINANLGGSIAFGGSLTSLINNWTPPEEMFAAGGNLNTDQRLLILNPAPIPEPGSMLLLATVLLGIIVRQYVIRN
jgi:hypothetical protein